MKPLQSGAEVGVDAPPPTGGTIQILTAQPAGFDAVCQRQATPPPEGVHLLSSWLSGGDEGSGDHRLLTSSPPAEERAAKRDSPTGDQPHLPVAP